MPYKGLSIFLENARYVRVGYARVSEAKLDFKSSLVVPGHEAFLEHL